MIHFPICDFRFFNCCSNCSLCEFETLVLTHDSFSDLRFSVFQLLFQWLPLRIRDSAINAWFIFRVCDFRFFNCCCNGSLCEFETLLSTHASFFDVRFSVFQLLLQWLPLRIRDSGINAWFIFRCAVFGFSTAAPMAPFANSRLWY